MTQKEMLFEMMKSVAPVVVQQGVNLMERLANNGNNPTECTIGGKSIIESYAESARMWAEALVKELDSA